MNIQPNMPAQGVGDAGGGTAFRSTRDQVNGALDEALKLASEKNPGKNIFVQFWRDKGKASKHQFIRKPTHLFPKFTASGRDRFVSPELRAISHNKMLRLQSGDCLNTEKEINKDASVSAHNLNADVCFSLGNLTRVPPSSLLREVLSLVLHEAVHMGGANETEAIVWQRQFSNYFGARFGDLSSDTISEDTLKKLGEAQAVLGDAQRLAQKNPQSPLIYELVGRLSNILGSLPDISDPLALELKIDPPRPELIDNYRNSVQGLSSLIKFRFELGAQNLIVHGMEFRFGSLSPDQVLPALLEVGDDLNQVNQNFLAFIEDSPDVHSRCLFPRTDRFGSVALGGSSVSTFSLGSVTGCSNSNDF